MKLLNSNERENSAKTLKKYWLVESDKISCVLKFDDFIQAFSFMTSIAIHAEKMNHHPNWANVYNTVEIALSTHDAGGLTELDFALALKIDKIYGSIPS